MTIIRGAEGWLEAIWNLRRSKMRCEFCFNLSFVMRLMLQLQFVLNRDALKLVCCTVT
jgi:hypothetical protein